VPPPAATTARPLWLFLAEPGVGPLLLRELKFRDVVVQKAQAAKLHLRNYDLIVLPDAAMRERTARPRLALQVLVAPVFGREQISDTQFKLLAHAAKIERPDGLVMTIAGDQFARRDIAPFILRQLGERQLRLENNASPRRPIWFLAVDEKFYFGFSRFNHHDVAGRDRGSEREGSLPPTIAAAMAFAAKPGEQEVIWDPVAGSGTILAELAEIAPGATLIGSDIDARALDLARKRLARKNPRLLHGDALEVRLGKIGLSLTIANLPFGKQFVAAGGNEALYGGILRRSLKIAGKNWRAVLLTSDTEALERAVAATGGLSLEEIATVQVRGVKAMIWQVTRAKA
jgi:precorrin-6B methylase 2